MISFKQFVLERVYRLSEVEQESVNDIVDFYMNLFDPKRLKMPIAKIITLGPQRVYKDYINEKGYITIGLVKFHDDEDDQDKQIPVYVGFDKKSKDKGTYIYDADTHEEYIVLHYYKLKYDREFIEDALVHELNHAKQPYKNPGKHYDRSTLDYYTDPVEVHNYVSNIVHIIEKEYEKNPTEVVKALEEYIRNGGYAPGNIVYKAIEKIGKSEFVVFLYNNKDKPKVKKEYQRFINKLTWLLDSFKEYDRDN